MTENKLETELSPSEKKYRDVLSYLSSLVFDSTPPYIPDSVAEISEVQKLAETLKEIRSSLTMAKNGDFSFLVKSKGYMAGSLKALQSNLNHIAFLARQVADGDFSQRMEFIGEFSSAFNSMTEQLDSLYKELNIQRDKYAHRALHDPLTGLKNRAYFDEQIINEIARAKRGSSLLAVVVVDVDKFKIVNDTMGHQAGDELLVEIANRLLRSTREIDTVARIGGDEFGMLWPNYAGNKQHFIKIRDRVISNINAYFELDGSEYKISVSMGISVYPHDGEDPQSLYKAADRAMYRAKRICKTACVFLSLDKF
jgi:diguanylate cyclase (GGDEF)-like protein